MDKQFGLESQVATGLGWYSYTSQYIYEEYFVNLTHLFAPFNLNNKIIPKNFLEHCSVQNTVLRTLRIEIEWYRGHLIGSNLVKFIIHFLFLESLASKDLDSLSHRCLASCKTLYGQRSISEKLQNLYFRFLEFFKK